MSKVFVLLTIIVFHFTIAFTFDGTFSISADNTYSLAIDGVTVADLCPDVNVQVSGSDPPSCFWSQASTYSFNSSSSVLIALRVRNVGGVSGNPLSGYANPGAFLPELKINGNPCVNILPWSCIDNIQAQQAYDNNQPPITWQVDPDFPTSFWTTGNMGDYGVNTAQSWASLGPVAAGLYGGNSLWYQSVGRPNTGISENARWTWYNPNAPNTEIFCRLMIENSTCPGGFSPSPSSSPSFSSSVTPNPSNSPSSSVTSTPSNSLSPSSSITPTPSNSLSVTPTPSTSAPPASSSIVNPCPQSSSPSPSPNRKDGCCCDEIVSGNNNLIEEARDAEDKITEALQLLKDLNNLNERLDYLTDVIREATRLQSILH